MTRRRRWLIGSALALVAVPLLLLCWLLMSGGGRDFALSLAKSQLPAGALEIGEAQGSLSGPLSLRDVMYRQDDGLTLRIEALTLDHSLFSAISGQLSIRNLQLRGVHVDLPEAEEVATPFRLTLPERLPWPALELPLGVSLQHLEIEDLSVSQAGESLLKAQSVMGESLRVASGSVSAQRVQVRAEAGALDASADLRMAGVADGQLQAVWTTSDSTPAVATLKLMAKEGVVDLTLETNTGEQLRVETDSAMRWTMNVSAMAFDPTRWRLAEADAMQALAFSVMADGDPQQARLKGQVEQADQSLTFDTGTLELIEGGAGVRWNSLTLSPGSGGTVDSAGSFHFDPAALALRADMKALNLPTGEPMPRLDGVLQVNGPLDALVVRLDDTTLQQGDLSADITLLARLLSGGVRVEQLTLAQQAGGMKASGDLAWDPVLKGEFDVLIDRFNPAALAPDFPGSVGGRLRAHLDEDAEGLRLRVDVEQLEGQLRQRALAGQGWFAWHAGLASADLALRLGESRLSVKGAAREEMDLAVSLSPLMLSDVLDQASGRVQGEFSLRGTPEQPTLAGTLRGAGLALDEIKAAALNVSLDASLGAEPAGQATLGIEDLEAGGERFERVEVTLDGSRRSHALSLTAEGSPRRVALELTGGLSGEDWQGRVESLELALDAQAIWRLHAPTAVGWVGGVAQIEDACLADGGEGRLCIAASGTPSRFSAHGRLEGLRLQPLLDALGDVGLAVEGGIQAQFELVGQQGQIRDGRATLQLPSGSLAEDSVSERVLLRWQDLQVQAEWSPDQMVAELSGRLDERGSLTGRVEGGSPFADPEATFTGRVDLKLPDVAAIELVVPQLAAVAGQLNASGDLSGRWQSPTFVGSIALQDFAAEVPALGLRLRDSILALRSDGSRVELDGLLDSGEGKLMIEGALDGVFDGKPVGRVRVHGERFHAADTPFVRVWVSPDIEARLSERGLNLSGKVQVPEAALDLEHLEGSVVTSSDVVVIDPDKPAGTVAAQRLQARLDVELGDKVVLRGFGFDGGVSGSLQVTERSGRPTTARGTLNVRGNYRAYGQDLDIQRGRLLFSASPIDNPGLDVRAQRVVDSVTVGIEVSGTANQPMLTVWSEPALDQAEALSYLVLGRPLRAATSAEGAQLGEAAAAIGGNFLASKLGSRLGFDTFGVADSQALGGAAFTVGKYLSPALYLSYGVSLFGTGQVVTLRYLLNDKFDVEIESGSESRGGINYRYER